MSQLFEAIMVICFGISWPANIVKSYKARTAKGKSMLFLFLVLIGYFFGIASKFISGTINYVMIFYIINSIMVTADIILSFRNLALDRAAK